MRLTIIAPDSLYEHDVDPSMEVQDIQALIEAETGLASPNFILSTDNGVTMNEVKRSLGSYDLKGENGTIFLTFRDLPSAPSGPSGSSSSSTPGFPTNDAELERMRLQALGDPNLMRELRLRDPEMASAIQSGRRFKEAFEGHQEKIRRAAEEKDRQIAALNADPYDIEAQKKIEEAIRMEAVNENMSHAMEYSPESFGHVTMLYINVEVNGHPVKAFVDSGAQSTIISPECAERCGIMRLLDDRFAGLAMGVGTARILGRVHSAQIKLGNLFLPCSFSVLEGRSVDLLFGLDMLKRHQACIDLASNVLRIGNVSIPFLAEHELPDSARRQGEQEMAEELGEAASVKNAAAGSADPKSSSATSSSSSRSFPGAGKALGSTPVNRNATTGPSHELSSMGQGSGAGAQASKFPEESISTLINLGAPREQALSLLEASNGDVDVAASMMFG